LGLSTEMTAVFTSGCPGLKGVFVDAMPLLVCSRHTHKERKRGRGRGRGSDRQPPTHPAQPVRRLPRWSRINPSSHDESAPPTNANHHYYSTMVSQTQSWAGPPSREHVMQRAHGPAQHTDRHTGHDSLTGAIYAMAMTDRPSRERKMWADRLYVCVCLYCEKRAVVHHHHHTEIDR